MTTRSCLRFLPRRIILPPAASPAPPRDPRPTQAPASLLRLLIIALASSAGAIAPVSKAAPGGPAFTAGSFAGLFHEFDQPRPNQSGALSVKLTAAGTFSGSLNLGTSRLPFSGRFSAPTSSVEVLIRRTGAATLNLQLAFADTDTLTGTLTDGNWTAQVTGDRLVWHKTSRPATAHAGLYTASIDRGDGSSSPGGFGYGTITVDAAGAVKFAGRLGDGSPVTQKATLSRSGLWPLFLPAYGSRGSVLGWVPISNRVDTAGRTLWTKPAGVAGALYPAGFSLTPRCFVSPYAPPLPGQRLLEVANGYVSLEQGPLSTPLVTEFALGTDNRVVPLGSQGLTLKFTPKSGLFSGTVNAPGGGAKLKFSGIVFQAADLAVGHFLSSNRSGSVVIAGDSP